MKITLDQEKCVGAGQCVLSAPDVFDQREEDGVAFLLTEEPGEELHASAVEAEGLCPAAAIRTAGP